MATTKSEVAAKILAADPLIIPTFRDTAALAMAAAIRTSHINLAPSEVAARAYADADALLLASSLSPDRLGFRETNGRLERVKASASETRPETSAEHRTGPDATAFRS